MATYAIDLSVVQSAANLIKRDLVISPATLQDSELEKLKFGVLTDIQGAETEFISLAYSGAVRPYDQSVSYTENDAKKVAMLIERRMKTYLSFRPAVMNAQAFREKEPFPATDKVDSNTLTRLPQTEFTLRQAAEMYGQEILQAVFHGDRTKGKDSAYGIFDGLYAHIKKDMTSYTDESGNEVPILIGKDKGNLIETAPITKPTSTSDFTAFEVFEQFVEALDPSLTSNPEGVLVYVDSKKAPWIFQAYMNRYPNLQNTVKYDGTYKFFGMDNITLIGTPLMGNTDTLIATRPGNCQFGVDSKRDDNNVSIDKIGFDPNKLGLWIQSAQGTRLLNPTKAYFAVSCDESGALYEATPYPFGDLQL